MSRLQILEQEQEQLNGSLMALTTHFAQVQFRLKQIVSAPNEDKEVAKFLNLKYSSFIFVKIKNKPKITFVFDQHKRPCLKS
jgi:prefoldin subunit 5